MKTKILIIATLFLSFIKAVGQDFKTAETKDIALFPQQNEFRNKENISGIWKFQKDSLDVGEAQNWKNGLPNTRSIAVPGSWNDQFTDSRDYLGTAWYEKEIFIPSSWKGQKIYVRIGSANYASKVYLNGKSVGAHEGGNLPFAFDISALINWNVANRITIQLENILKPTRVPTGGGVAGGMFSSNPKANFDFFPYAGLQRDVLLYSVQSAANIKDLTVVTGFENTTGSVNLKVDTEGKATKGKVTIAGNNKVYESEFDLNGNTANVLVKIPEVRLWSTEDPFLYKVSVSISDANRVIDTYELETGVRTISTNDKQILLNGKPVFLKGFGKHEDFPIFGRATANPVIIKDYSLLKWVGANSYRTSHYPYDEEYMNMADREGILIINEIPAVGLYFHGDKEELRLRQIACKKYIEELITRDKNHPSVVMWSVANEPFPEGINLSPNDVKKADPQSVVLFKELFDLVKKLDPTRLKTLVGVMGGPVEWLALSDVVCINRYWGWYTNQGDIKTGAKMLSDELDDLYSKLKKPIVITEFGADTFPGMHADQAEMFTEEYQVQFIKAYLDVADTKDFVAGMHVWAFADFKTGQSVIRFGGMNYKGVFTRDRKPKMAAHYLRERWTKKPEDKK
ncbi:beta-glucuronidase [Flavobacterium sp. ZT3R17]|uniref:beta-glucuronidase n=1 Tax=Flavobacterium cryoconiti TaxID=3398736 RepID=UPI003A836FE6